MRDTKYKALAVTTISEVKISIKSCSRMSSKECKTTNKKIYLRIRQNWHSFELSVKMPRKNYRRMTVHPSIIILVDGPPTLKLMILKICVKVSNLRFDLV